ncbi:hypothetical protein [Dysgonomonas macrotermitis]|uniref:Uncharacterized protein n=1 Tax=Dysgonomonas macrotermitis TaxID=1346286 RepID=A0A1M4UNY6_9BACT|nr:hypothetical protein [Dysgonomonas macrotermitis]SHE58404.1 hypothetical protein SAMN05444362_101657 [Dysgonomonas macrotermitis]
MKKEIRFTRQVEKGFQLFKINATYTVTIVCIGFKTELDDLGCGQGVTGYSRPAAIVEFENGMITTLFIGEDIHIVRDII